VSKLRITFVVASENLSGGQRVISIYADRLARRGHHITMVVPAIPSPTIKSRVRSLLRGQVPVHKEGIGSRSYFHDAIFNVHRLEHSGPVQDRDLPDADVLVANWWETVPWVWAASPSKGAKLHFMQDYETWGTPNGDISQLDAVIGLPIPKIVIVQWVAELLKKKWGQTPLALIHNSVQTDRFFASVRGKQKIPTVGFAYRTMHNKGCDVIVEAVERARKRVPDLRVISFGQQKPIPELPLPARTEFHFRAEDERLRHLYGACDAWLFGTRIEGFGLPILEAMACRTPVIGTPAGAAPRLIAQGGGILVAMEDVSGMADAIARVAAMTEEDWRRMSDAAYSTATSYTWDDATDQFETALMRAARSGTQRVAVN
jgi:glycosyltransferase involved in cell wall biosynthesis